MRPKVPSRAIRLGIDDWPYGVDEQDQQELLLKWAETYNLRYDGKHCICWLRRGASDISRYLKDGSDFRSSALGNDRCYDDYSLDHVTCWTHDGDPAVLVSQPYRLHEEARANFEALASDGLTVRIHDHGWYGNGTVCVEVWALRPESLTASRR
jgi:hypothetical protein